MLSVVVLAHGSRDPLWRAPVEAVAQSIRAQSADTLVHCAYLELCEPSLSDTVTSVVAQGATRVRVLPLFFGMGKHAREDLPLLMATLGQDYPEVRFELLPAAGEDPRLTSLLAQIVLENTP